MKKFDFYCTAGRGTEKFVKKEIQDNGKICKDVEIDDIDGKVFFSLIQNVSIKDVTALKTVERVFLKVCHSKTPKTSRRKGKKIILEFLTNHLLDREIWKNIESCLESLRLADETDCSLSKKPKLETDEEYSKTFRVSCKSTGGIGKICSGQDTARFLGANLSRLLPWKVDLRNPDLEICIHISDTYITAGIPLTRIPVSRRPYVKYSGLRSTISYIMADLLRIQTGDIVLDPMCGKGTILIEAAHSNSDIVCFGCDQDLQQLSIARQNLEHAQLQSVIQLIKINAKDNPFLTNSVDKVVCDVPFGIKFKFESSVDEFFQSVLSEINRVLKSNGLAVLLVGREVKQCIYRLLKFQPSDRSPSEDGKQGESFKSASCSSSCIPSDDKPCLEVNEPDTDKKTTDIVREYVDKNEFKIDNASFISSPSKIVDEFVDSECEKKLFDQSLNSSSKKDSSVLDKDVPDPSEDISEIPVDSFVDQIDSTPSLDCSLNLLEEHYVKLGETDAFICVLRKCKD